MLFVLVCVVPTTVIVGWGVWRRMPGYAKDEARRLSLLLGMRVSLTAVRHPRPGETVYEGLELVQPRDRPRGAPVRSPPRRLDDGQGPGKPLAPLSSHTHGRGARD